jgi:hydroxymethylglutaryl-CoA lyase
MHSRPQDAAAKVVTAYDAGCLRFDSAIGGLGGCPFAQDELVGNIPTEVLIQSLISRAAELPKLKSLDRVMELSAGIAEEYSVTT